MQSVTEHSSRQASQSFLDHARALAQFGWSVFPCVRAPGTRDDKRPLTTNGFYDATRDEAILRAWAAQWPNARVGVPTGLNGLCVVDLDVKHGKNGVTEWIALEAKHGALDTFTVRTDSGGLHLYYAVPGGAGTGLKSTVDQLARGVDTRAEGGYVIAYTTVLANLPIAPVPAWLAAALPAGAPRERSTAELPDIPRRAVEAREILAFATRLKRPDLAAAKASLLAMCNGEAWGARGGRDNAITRIFALLGTAFPDLDPAALLDWLEPARLAVEREDGCPTDRDYLEEKIWNALRAVHGYAKSLKDEHARTLEEMGIAPVPVARHDAANDAIVTAADSTYEYDERPTITVTTRLGETVDEAVAALTADREIYQRDGRLVRVVRVATADAERARMAVGTPQIRELHPATLCERLTRVASWRKYDARKDDYIPTQPPDRVVAAVVARGEWTGIRPLIGVIETPSMRPDGTVLDIPGYDAATGYLYAPARDYPQVPAEPGHDDARAALRMLQAPWVDFPVTGTADRSVPIAALLTMVARPAVAGACPAFLFDASTRGSGKTLMARAVTMLAHGREAALMSWPGDTTELEKVLGAYALRAASVICWDNVVGEFGGGPLDKVLTCADRVELRVLGKSEAPALAWRAVMLAGGNNMAIGGDTTRRVLVCRLEPMMEKPEERTSYQIVDLMAWCRAQHPAMVAACLTMLRAYVVAGRPPQGLTGWGSFEPWRDLIANAIVWAGGDDVTKCRPTVAGQDDGETAALRVILERLPGLSETKAWNEGCTTAQLIEALYPASGTRPAEAEALREAVEVLAPPVPGKPPTSLRLGHAFKKHRRRVVGGWYLDARRDRLNTSRWVIHKTVQGMQGMQETFQP